MHDIMFLNYMLSDRDKKIINMLLQRKKLRKKIKVEKYSQNFKYQYNYFYTCIFY